MRKIILFILLLITINNNVYSDYECTQKEDAVKSLLQEIDDLKYKMNNLYDEIQERYIGTGTRIQIVNGKYLKEYGDLETLYNNKLFELKEKNNSYTACYDNYIYKLDNLFDDGYNAYNEGNYDDSISYYKQYLNLLGDETEKNYKIAKSNMILALTAQGDNYYNKKDYNKALEYYIEILKYDQKNDKILLNIGVMYYNLKDFNNSKKYLNNSYNITTNSSYITLIEGILEDIKIQEKNKELQKNAPTNDTLSGYQYYLKQLNIPNSWKKVKNNNQVIVAVIDDGININHPDLVNSIWTNKNAKYGDSKIIDFVGDGMPANLPVGEHGTMIAGIIGATQNNNEGIAGIAKNVKFMPLRVFDAEGNANEENIIDAISYAIDNGANIINLSLGQSQFYYSDKYDKIIKKAFDKGVVVVIAAGNGDLLSGGVTGVNLTNNPISPVCNNEGKYKYSIGVYATDVDGYKTNWTNYGNCAQFFAPGVGIVSTSISIFNSNYGDNYNMSDGTSFSAPIISGIIALGYNQYGYINPIIIYDSLEESKVKDEKVGYKIDASKYLDIIGKKVEEQKNKQKAEIVFNSIKKQLNKKSKNKRENYYDNLLKQLNPIKDKLTGDKSIIVNHLIYLLNQEINK